VCMTLMGALVFLSPKPHIMTYPPRKRVLILDLDETLVHSTVYRPALHRRFRGITISSHGQVHTFYVFKRPYVEHFLEQVQKYYDLYIFTASIQSYADPVIDTIFPKKYFVGRIYREACVLTQGNYVKDLTLLGGTDLSNTILVDNSPVSYSRNEDNAVPISNFMGSSFDNALLNLVPFLEALAFVKDVRSILGLRKALLRGN